MDHITESWVIMMINCKTCVYKNACDYEVDNCEMYIQVPDISRTVKMLEIEKQCVLRQDTPQCTRECSFCDLVQNADEVISAYDTAINILKQLLEKLEGKVT